MGTCSRPTTSTAGCVSSCVTSDERRKASTRCCGTSAAAAARARVELRRQRGRALGSLPPQVDLTAHLRSIVITGAPGVGKTTICRLISPRLPRAAHIQADALHRMIISGGEWPSTGTREAQMQLLLRTRNAAQMAANFARAGIIPIVDEVIATKEQLDIVEEVLAGVDVTFIVLTACVETVLERDAGRDKHTAARYLGVDQLITGVLAGRATLLDSTDLSSEETVACVQAIVPDVEWRAAASTAGSGHHRRTEQR